MVDFNVWRGSRHEAIDETARAAGMWAIIQRDGENIVLWRDGVEQTAQTMRVELDSIANEMPGDMGRVATQRLILFGVINHATEPDTDIQQHDRFYRSDNTEYKVIQVNTLPGQIQAIAERVG